MPEAPEDVIVVDGLTKRYEDLVAVDNVSFTVRQGEILGILGPNGAGKTTTLECIEGLQEPTSGTTEVLGYDTHSDAVAVKERIGVQLQASAYFDYLNLTEILDLFGRFYHRRLEPSDLLSRVSLTDKATSTVAKLSGGQQQRFTFAATLVNDPDVVILDEPTSGLDPQARRDLWELIKEINADGRTIVLTTHHMEEAEQLCDRVAVMDRGKIVALDTPQNLIATLPTPYEVRITPSNGARTESLQHLVGVAEVNPDDNGTISIRTSDASETLRAVMDWGRESGVVLTHLEVVPASLEDVFLSLTGKTFE